MDSKVLFAGSSALLSVLVMVPQSLMWAFSSANYECVQASETVVSHCSGLYLSQSVDEAQGDRPEFFERDQETLESETSEIEAAFPPIAEDHNEEEWRPFIFREANFSVWLPVAGTMSSEIKVLDTAIGTIEFDLITNYLEPRTYSAAYSEILAPEQLEAPDLIFGAVLDEVIADTGFELDSEESSINESIPGLSIPIRDLVLINNDERIYLKMGLVGERVYVLGVNDPLGDDGVIRRAAVEELYFSSFRYSPY